MVLTLVRSFLSLVNNGHWILLSADWVDLLLQAFYVLTKSSSEQAIIVGSELLFNLSFNNLSIIMAI
ncbi:hypothetical protein J8137_23745, partial [Lactiplantibacillus plantarum]|nr:hypothetical protein [Lactiplantibacillus plantarum]